MFHQHASESGSSTKKPVQIGSLVAGGLGFIISLMGFFKEGNPQWLQIISASLMVALILFFMFQVISPRYKSWRSNCQLRGAMRTTQKSACHLVQELLELQDSSRSHSPFNLVSELVVGCPEEKKTPEIGKYLSQWYRRSAGLKRWLEMHAPLLEKTKEPLAYALAIEVVSAWMDDAMSCNRETRGELETWIRSGKLGPDWETRVKTEWATSRDKMNELLGEWQKIVKELERASAPGVRVWHISPLALLM